MHALYQERLRHPARTVLALSIRINQSSCGRAETELATQTSLASAKPSSSMSLDDHKAVSDAVAHPMGPIPVDCAADGGTLELTAELSSAPACYEGMLLCKLIV